MGAGAEPQAGAGGGREDPAQAGARACRRRPARASRSATSRCSVRTGPRSAPRPSRRRSRSSSESRRGMRQSGRDDRVLSPSRERARAKINLTLTVLGRRADGYHELESLVTFADVDDVVTLEPGAPHASTVGGPFAQDIDGENLLARALALLRQAEPGLQPGIGHAGEEPARRRRSRRRLGRCGGAAARRARRPIPTRRAMSPGTTSPRALAPTCRCAWRAGRRSCGA